MDRGNYNIPLAFLKMHGNYNLTVRPGPKVIDPFSCLTQLSLKYIMLINVKIPTIVGI